jgi:hypothetical protein
MVHIDTIIYYFLSSSYSLHGTGSQASSDLAYSFHLFQGLPRSRRPFGSYCHVFIVTVDGVLD